MPELREKCDYVVVLACMPIGDAIQLAIDHSGIDMILNGFEHQSAMPSIKVSQSTIVYAEDEAKSLGELRFSLKSGRASVQPLNHRLTRRVADDPDVAAFMVKAKADISARQSQMALKTAHVHGHDHSHGSHQDHADSDFVTSQTCGTCHVDAFQAWEGSAHAHAIDILKRERKEFDTQCVVCHVTGSGQPGGFEDLYRTAHLANVQCEACHGQGREHSQQPTVVKMRPLGPNSCVDLPQPVQQPRVRVRVLLGIDQALTRSQVDVSGKARGQMDLLQRQLAPKLLLHFLSRWCDPVMGRKPPRERGRPARTNPPAASAISSTGINRQRRPASASAGPMRFPPAGRSAATSQGN